MNKYYLVKLLTNSLGQDAPSVAVYTSKENALIAYHNTLASYHNAPDVMYAVVMILNEIGNCEMVEIVSHPIPEPEPEPEPEPSEGE